MNGRDFYQYQRKKLKQKRIYEFLYALIFMSSGAMKTVAVGTVSDLIKADKLFWGALMASAILGSIPVALIYSFFVKDYVSSLTASAVNG